jgi:hypothetical protein
LFEQLMAAGEAATLFFLELLPSLRRAGFFELALRRGRFLPFLLLCLARRAALLVFCSLLSRVVLTSLSRCGFLSIAQEAFFLLTLATQLCELVLLLRLVRDGATASLRRSLFVQTRLTLAIHRGVLGTALCLRLGDARLTPLLRRSFFLRTLLCVASRPSLALVSYTLLLGAILCRATSSVVLRSATARRVALASLGGIGGL